MHLGIKLLFVATFPKIKKARFKAILLQQPSKDAICFAMKYIFACALALLSCALSAREVYVSSSEGIDTNDGSKNAPLKTLAAAPKENAKIFLKRGDTFYEELKNFKNCDITKDIEIKNQQLYRLDHAPICRECDAYHCKRCVWLNRKLTLEVNTPSHEQCIVAHTERNASKRLLEDINKTEALIDNTIENLDYIDPFDKFKKL